MSDYIPLFELIFILSHLLKNTKYSFLFSFIHSRIHLYFEDATLVEAIKRWFQTWKQLYIWWCVHEKFSSYPSICSTVSDRFIILISFSVYIFERMQAYIIRYILNIGKPQSKWIGNCGKTLIWIKSVYSSAHWWI